MINWNGKAHPALVRQIEAAGLRPVLLDGTWTTANDAAAQTIIDAFDPLPDAKKDAIAAVKATGLAKIQAAFPAIDSFDALDFYSQLWLSIASAARAPTTRFSNIIAIYQAGANAITQINAAASTAAVAAVVPAWP